MNCPRCQRAIADTDVACARCGAPLVIADDPPPAPLDRVIDLDRRFRRSDEPAITEPMPHGDEPTAFARSVGEPAAPIAEPAGPLLEPEDSASEPAGPVLLGATEPTWTIGALPEALAEPASTAEPRAELTAAPTPAPIVIAPELRVPVLRRLGAAALDAALVAGFAAVPVLLAARTFPGGHPFEALFPACATFVALLGFTYAVLGHTLMGATVGKRLLGLRVTGPGGTAPGLARSAARGAVAVIGTAGLGLGMVVGLFTSSGRALHDVIAGTSVVRAVDPSQRGA